MNTATNYCLDNVSKRDAVLSPPLTPALSHPFDKRQSTDMNYPPSQYTRPYPMENYHHWMNPNAPFPMQQQLQQTMAMPPRPTTKPARKQPSKQNKHSCNYPDCQWSFKRYEHLKRHMLVHTGERPHVCPHPGCGKRFSRSDNFHAHYRTHEKKAYYAKQKQQQQQQQQDYAVKEEQQHPSNFMHNPYYQQQQQYQLLKQQESFGGYNEERQEVKPHECNDCGKRFRRLEHLKRHMRIHTNEQPFKCSFPGCLKAFSRSDNLTQHKRTHERRKQGDLDDSFAYDLHPIMSWQNPGDTETVGC